MSSNLEKEDANRYTVCCPWVCFDLSAEFALRLGICLQRPIYLFARAARSPDGLQPILILLHNPLPGT